MKKLVILTLLVFAQTSFATNRVNLFDLTTDEARALVQEQGAVIFNTGKYTYERVVANGSHCYLGEVTEAFFGKTLDSDSAYVGKTCEDYSGGR